MPRCDALFKCWKHTPPVALSMASYVGWGQSNESASADDLDQLLASAPVKEFNPHGNGR